MDLGVVLLPEPSLVLELPTEKSLLLLPRETAAFAECPLGILREENVKNNGKKINQNQPKFKTQAEVGTNRELIFLT